MDLMDPVLKGPADQTSDPWGAGAAAAGPASDPWQSYGKHTQYQLDCKYHDVYKALLVGNLFFLKKYVNVLVHLGHVNLNINLTFSFKHLLSSSEMENTHKDCDV